MRTVRVAPAGDWWAVRCDSIDNDMLFRSGARAELTAKRLAASLATGGDLVKLEILARDGVVAGRFVCPPQRSPQAGFDIGAPTRELEAA